jgi:hypothetical protein
VLGKFCTEYFACVGNEFEARATLLPSNFQPSKEIINRDNMFL